MQYFVIAYPEIAAPGLQQIQACRQQHDRQYAIVPPHFTLVFAIDGYSEKDFIDEVRRRSTGIKSINFVLRSAIIQKDAFSENYHVFLVPEEGFGSIVQLHDQLYSGSFASELRHDTTYIPHITIGGATDVVTCQKLADEWNEKDFAISGAIGKLSVVAYEYGIIRLLDEIVLL